MLHFETVLGPSPTSLLQRAVQDRIRRNPAISVSTEQPNCGFNETNLATKHWQQQKSKDSSWTEPIIKRVVRCADQSKQGNAFTWSNVATQRSKNTIFKRRFNRRLIQKAKFTNRASQSKPKENRIWIECEAQHYLGEQYGRIFAPLQINTLRLIIYS